MATPSDNFNRILVIDDNPSIHDDFRKILAPHESASELDNLSAKLFGTPTEEPRAEQFVLDGAHQGQEGLEKVMSARRSGKPYGMAFVDVRMPPGWDGVETTERLWQEDPNLQIVICTAYSDISWPEMTQRIGREDKLLVLKKPFDVIEVKQLASALCEKRRLLELAQLRQSELQQMVDIRTSELRELAESDPLTKLPNRVSFLRAVEECIEARRSGTDRADAVMFIDLDNFKLVNDSLGHSSGDSLLIQVADRLRRNMRRGDQIFTSQTEFTARLGGDEFAVLVHDVLNGSEGERVAKRLLNVMQDPFSIADRDINVSISIGLAMVDEHTKDAQDVIRKADTAMYHAKTEGKNCASLFDDAMHERATARLSLESDLQAALQQRQFELFLQPIFALDSMAVTGYESLLRWRSSDGRIRAPGDFIETAEETGLIVPLGIWVFDEACRILSNPFWKDEHGDTRRLSVNVSRRQLLEPSLAADIEEQLTKWGVDGSLINIEITETAIIQNGPNIETSLKSLRDLGLQIHMDDFGTGMSSLSCLHNFPIDVIKIDRSFVSGEGAENRTAIVEAIIGMAKKLDINVTAEGIETTAQLEFLKECHCDYGQGFLLGRPAPLPDQSTQEKEASFPSLR